MRPVAGSEGRRVLVTGGRAPATLELCRLLSLGGCAVVVVDSVPFTMATFSRAVVAHERTKAPREDPERWAYELLDICRKYGCSMVIPTCEEVFWLGQQRHILEPLVIVFAPPFDVLHRLHHKGEFIQWAKELGLPTPETYLCTNRQQLRGPIESEPGAWVAKPAFSRFSTFVAIGPSNLDFLQDLQVSEQVPWVLQRRLQGRRLCSYSVVVQGQVMAHVTYPMDVCGSTGAALVFQSLDEPAVADWVASFARQTGITGQLSFDWFVVDDQVLPIECNPRLTSGIHCFRDQRTFAGALLASQGRVHPQAPVQALKLGLVLYGGSELVRRPLQMLSALTRAGDVIWRWSDPLPMLFHWVAYLWFLRWSWDHGVTPMAASTLDIEYNGPDERSGACP